MTDDGVEERVRGAMSSAASDVDLDEHARNIIGVVRDAKRKDVEMERVRAKMAAARDRLARKR
jgi:hypothetical protein